MSTLILTGAGASYGSGPCVRGTSIPDNPPLGCDLFERLLDFDVRLQQELSDLAPVFKRNFEDGMREVCRPDRRIMVPRFMNTMAEYLIEYRPLPGNAYIELLQAHIKSKRRTYYCSLNYDMMFEYASGRLRHDVTYSVHGSETSSINLAKLHGSVNFLPPAVIDYGGVFSNVDFGDPTKPIPVESLDYRP